MNRQQAGQASPVRSIAERTVGRLRRQRLLVRRVSVFIGWDTGSIGLFVTGEYRRTGTGDALMTGPEHYCEAERLLEHASAMLDITLPIVASWCSARS